MHTAYPQEPMTVLEWLEASAVNDWGRVELEDGRVVPVPAPYVLHATTSRTVLRRLVAARGWDLVLTEAAVQLTDDTAYLPDLVLLTADARPEAMGPLLASHCALVVEIAVSTVSRDRAKAPRYANAGIPEYWLIEPAEDRGTLTRYTHPSASGYGTVDHHIVGTGAEQLDVESLLGG